MKVKRWLENNSAALQAVGAIIAICSVLLAVPFVWKKIFKADLLLQVNFDQSTVPPGLLDWSRSFSRMLPDPDAKPPDKNTLAEELQRLRSSPVTEKLRTYRSYNGEIDKLSLDIRNQTDYTLTGVRIRVSNMDELWSAEVRGTYLTSDEALLFEKRLPPRAENQAVIIPELPPIPPDGVLTIVLYGKSWRPEVSLSASGVSSRIETLTKVKDSWFLTLYKDPWPIVLFSPFVVFLVVLLFSVKITRTDSSEDHKGSPPTATACEASPSAPVPQAQETTKTDGT